MDDFVDEKYRSHVNRILSDGKTAGDLKCYLSATLIMRYLERIADHSAYIGESVVYIITGQRSPRK